MTNAMSKNIWISALVRKLNYTSCHKCENQIFSSIDSTCNLDKDDCDLKFKRCLYGYCKGKFGKKKKPLQYLDRQKCKLKAKLFYITVVGVGCQAYRVAQKNACRCVKILERPRDSSKSKHHEKDELWCDIF